MARAISITVGAKEGNRDDSYSSRVTISDEDTDVQVWVGNGTRVSTRQEIANELIRLANFIDEQPYTGNQWPL